MDIRELSRLDLNLLVALEALLEERNVSLAAERLFITQSAMSKTLGRLRELFGDPLFVRKASRMIPTPRAEQLARELPQVLLAVQRMLRPTEFDPQTWEGELSVLVQGHMGVWFLPQLLKRLRGSAPHVRIHAISTAPDTLEMLADGRLDFAVQVEHHSYPPGYDLTTLGFAPPMLLARAGHPLQGRDLSWEQVLEYPQVMLIIRELDEIQFLAQQDSPFLRHERAVVPHLHTDNLYTAIQVVRNSDYLFPAPPMFLEQDELSRDLIALPLPGGEEVSMRYVVITHERLRHSAIHDFMYGEILAITECFRRRYGLPTLQQMRTQRNLAY